LSKAWIEHGPKDIRQQVYSDDRGRKEKQDRGGEGLVLGLNERLEQQCPSVAYRENDSDDIRQWLGRSSG
jgi:hypothetical protein